MLVKKELLTIPPLPMREVPKAEKRGYYYTVSAGVFELDRSGKILAVDFYRVRDKALVMRFFSDGKGYLCAKEWPAEAWSKCNPRNKLGYCSNYYSDATTDETVKSVLGNPKYKWMEKAESLLNDFVATHNYEDREKSRESTLRMMKEHFAMFPKLPEDLPDYCDEYVFPSGYLFFSKKDGRGRRQARCGVCGHTFEPESNVHHNLRGHCPSCGRRSLYKAEWIKKSCQDDAKICIAERVNGQLILRWIHVTRHYSWPEFKKRYFFSDQAYNLYLDGKKNTILYSYYIGNWGWNRLKNGTACSTVAHVYTGNLRQVFGETFHGVNLEDTIHPREEMQLGILLRNLEQYPATEYLLKLGLTKLADKAEYLHPAGELKKPTFSGVLGVSKQLLPMYQSMNVTWFEHQIIRGYGKWVSEQDLEELRMLDLAGCSVDDVQNLLKTMSIQRFNHYFLKQKHESPDRKMSDLITKYRDYVEMSMGLNIDLSRKSVRFPQDIVMAHDRLLKVFEPVKDEATERLFAMKVKEIYADMPLPEKVWKKYCVVLPQLRSDLIREGSSLNHCVGKQERYYKNHMAGTKMIFFIRRIEKQEKPFVTMEVDMKTLHILQIYGFGDKSPEPEVRRFAENWLKELGKSIQKGQRKTA